MPHQVDQSPHGVFVGTDALARVKASLCHVSAARPERRAWEHVQRHGQNDIMVSLWQSTTGENVYYAAGEFRLVPAISDLQAHYTAFLPIRSVVEERKKAKGTEHNAW